MLLNKGGKKPFTRYEFPDVLKLAIDQSYQWWKFIPTLAISFVFFFFIQSYINLPIKLL